MSAQDVLDRLIAQIPHNLNGVERQKAIGDLVSQQALQDRHALREMLDSFLLRMSAENASDIDLGGEGCCGKIWYRIHGIKNPDESRGSFDLDETDMLLQSILVENQRRFLLTHRNLDFSYETESEGQRFRGNMCFDLDHLALNMRSISSQMRPFKDLELHPNVARSLILKYDKQGLTLVTGITGSGKSSTLDSIIDTNNQIVDAHIVIIGDPIETIHHPKRCVVRHREVGRDVLSFKDGAVQSLRQDPDMIVIGEMRDPDTIMTALEITDSGHKVFSTLHTSSAVESIDRIVAECASEEQNRVRERLADTLKCVISQKLVPSLDGKRALAKEIMLVSSSVKAAIRNKNIGEIYQMIFESGSSGMITMEQDLARLCEKGKISADEAMSHANNKKRAEELLQRL